MEKQVASLYADIGAKTDKFEKGKASVIGGLGKVALSVGTVTSAIKVMEQAWEFGREGAQLSRLADAGTEMARQFDGNMQDIVSSVKAASLGTVSEMDIIASSNKAMMLGLGADAEKLANLMEIAAFRGRAMGVSTTQAFDDIVRGVGRASPLILDNLGIVVKLGDVNQKYAESIGKTVKELTAAEKKQALLNSVLDEGNRMLDEAGGLAEDGAAQFERLAASTKNLGDSMKRDLGDSLSPVAGAMADAIDANVEYSRALELSGQTQRGFAAKATTMGLSIGEYTNYLIESAEVVDDWASRHANAAGEFSSASDEITLSIEEQEAAMKELTKQNEGYLSMIDDITSSDQRLIDDQNEINRKYADGKITLDERNAALDELAAKQEEASKRMILSMLQEQLAADGLKTTEMEYLLSVGQEWGVYSASAVEAANAAIAKSHELADAFNNLPTRKDMQINIYTNQTSIGASVQQAALSSASRGHASGGSFLIPMSYGNEGFRMGNGDTASGGEMVTITPRGQQGGGLSDVAMIAASIPTARDNAKALARELMKLGLGTSR